MATLGDAILGEAVLWDATIGLGIDPPAWYLAPHCTVVIAGVVQDMVPEWHTDLAFDRIATADLVAPLPLGLEITEGATVEILAAARAGDAQRRVFWGRVNVIEPGLSDAGKVAHLRCAGMAWALTLPLERELRFAGGLPTEARFLSSQVFHVGSQTIGWYADPSPDGLTVDVGTFTPAADVRFVHLTGRVHGSNSYPEDPDRDIRDFSRLELWQDGRRRGYANLPRTDERWRDELDYGDDDQWRDLDFTIGAALDAGTAVTVRAVSGRKPGASERDEYELAGLTYQTAGRTSARDLLRSILRDRGYGPGLNGVPYRVAPIVDLAGLEILLGGNGLIDNGQVVVPEGQTPWSWMGALANLWGYRLVDGPDGIDVVPARGEPSGDPVASFMEGVDIFEVTRSRDVGQVVTSWRVTGASGADEYGQPFRYESITDPNAVASPSFLPDPPGLVAGQVRSDLLVSDGLARGVRQIKEIEHEAIPIALTLNGVVPSPALTPGAMVRVTVPSNGVDRALWVTGVRHDWDESGFWSSVTARSATGLPNPEADRATDPREQPSSATRHIGLTRIRWYRRRDPDGATVRVAFHPGGAFRGLRVTGRAHGANSFASGSKPADGAWSSIEIWQLGVKIGAAPLPIIPERWDRRLDYGDDRHWADLDVMIAADLVDASAELRFTCGTARDDSRDDYEVRNLEVALYSVATEQPPVATSGADWHAYQSRRAWRWAS